MRLYFCEKIDSCFIRSDDSDQVSSNVSSVSNPVRRVARKSTKPPSNPQRTSEMVNIGELLLAENEDTAASPKRKAELLEKPSRKVARKSTRPPVNPQRTKETLSEINPSTESLNSSLNVSSSSLLLESPVKVVSLSETMDELVILDESIC